MILNYFFYLIYNLFDFIKPARGSSFQYPEYSGWFILSGFVYLNIRELIFYIHIKVPLFSGNGHLDMILEFICINVIFYFWFLYRKRYIKIIEKFKGEKSYLFGLGLPLIIIYCIVSLYFLV